MSAIPLEPLVFDSARAAWIPGQPPPRSPTDAVTLVTWNVWFGEYAFRARFEALLAIVRAVRPDVVCFQEIVAESLVRLREAPWIRAEYALSDAQGTTFDDYGVVILSRLPVRSLSRLELPTHMGRSLITAELDAGGRTLVVGAVHLESRKPNAETRAEQLELVFPHLKGVGADGVVAGDFNFCSSWTRENARIDPEFVDIWPALRGRDPGYTEDSDVNAMLRNQKATETHVRFDRVLLRSPEGAFRATSIERLGTAPIDVRSPDVFPSDHFGLAVVLERTRRPRGSDAPHSPCPPV